MFPTVKVVFSLSSSAALANQQQQQVHSDKYHVLMDILPYDSKRYRYAYHKSSWQQAGKADQAAPTRLFLHPDGPFSVEKLTHKDGISFEKVKLTNNDVNKHGHVSITR